MAQAKKVKVRSNERSNASRFKGDDGMMGGKDEMDGYSRVDGGVRRSPLHDQLFSLL